MKVCEECYSKLCFITPLLNPVDCLTNHEQYICGTCGRCICIAKTKNTKLQRWNYPFKSLAEAMLYLRTAEYSTKTNCGIYELTIGKRKQYKIFKNLEDAVKYLDKHFDYQITNKAPIYQNETYVEYPKTEIKRLSPIEITNYLKKRENI